MSYFITWLEYLKGKIKGETILYQIVPNLYQSPEIRNSEKVLDAGINVVVDLAGGLDPESLADGLTYYLYWPIRDEAKLPDLYDLRRVAQFVWGCMMGAPPKIVLIH